MVELDLRQIVSTQRHELIFQKWDALKSGETVVKQVCRFCRTNLFDSGNYLVIGTSNINKTLHY